MSEKYLILLCLLLLVPLSMAQIGVRSVMVKGTLKCGKEAATNVKINLYRANTKDEKQLLDTREVGPSGQFEVTGNTNGRPLNETELEAPTVRFFHRCDTPDDKDSMRSFQLVVPKDFVSLGKLPKKTFDIGTLNLELTYPKEEWIKNPK